MQGIFIDGARPASKKKVKEMLAQEPSRVRIEATSMFGNEYDGPADQMPDGKVYFVGPDPHVKRDFYGTIVARAGRLVVK